MMAMEHPKLKLLATKLNDGKNRSDDNRRGDIGVLPGDVNSNGGNELQWRSGRN